MYNLVCVMHKMLTNLIQLRFQLIEGCLFVCKDLVELI